MCGHEVNWQNLLEAEQDPKKRQWLKVFSQPQHSLADVGLLADKVIHNCVREAEEPTPRSAYVFSFGYSCKDEKAGQTEHPRAKALVVVPFVARVCKMCPSAVFQNPSGRTS